MPSKETFAQGINKLCALYGKVLDKVTLELYREGVEGIEDNAFMFAISYIIKHRTGQYMPMPGDIREASRGYITPHRPALPEPEITEEERRNNIIRLQEIQKRIG